MSNTLIVVGSCFLVLLALIFFAFGKARKSLQIEDEVKLISMTLLSMSGPLRDKLEPCYAEVERTAVFTLKNIRSFRVQMISFAERSSVVATAQVLYGGSFKTVLMTLPPSEKISRLEMEKWLVCLYVWLTFVERRKALPPFGIANMKSDLLDAAPAGWADKFEQVAQQFDRYMSKHRT